MSKTRFGWEKIKRGQALVEFAIVMILLMLLIVGILDLGFAVYAKNTISSAAREGARTGIILSATDAQIMARIQAAAPALSNLQISIAPAGTRTFGQPITVTVSYTYTAITPIIGQIVTGSGLYLTASSSMMVEGVMQPIATATPAPSPTSTLTPTATPTACRAGTTTLGASRNGSIVSLSWGAVSGATNYQVYKSTTGSAGPYSLYVTTTSTSASDSIGSGQTFYYYILPIFGCGQGTPSNTASVSR